MEANWIHLPVTGGFRKNEQRGGATYDATFNKGGGNYTATPDTDVTIEDLLLNSGNAPLSHAAGTFHATGGILLVARTYQLSGSTNRNEPCPGLVVNNSC